MKWINKSDGRYRRLGRRIVEDFLHGAWDNTLNRYVNCDFASFKSNKKMLRLLMAQQHYHCCYCMRLLKVDYHTTLEHIMPHRSDITKDIEYFRQFNRKMKRFVKYYLVTTENSSEKLSFPPYPHFCAYENLVVSCDGNIPDPIASPRKKGKDGLPGTLHLCCNNVRGNVRIVPLFFIRHISRQVVYEADGGLTYDETRYKDTIQTIRLEHETLKLMRRTWAGIAMGNRFAVDDVRRACKDCSLRDTILMESLIPLRDSKTLQNDTYWNVLYSYNWFYGYFKKRQASKFFLH